MLTVQSVSATNVGAYPARVQATQDVDLSFRVAGPLVELTASPGTRVEAGAALARLDPRDFRSGLDKAAATLDESRATLSAMRKGARPEELLALEAGVRAAEAQHTDTKLEYERQGELLAAGIVAQSVVDRAQVAQEAAAAVLETARQQLEVGQEGARAEDIQAMEARIKNLEAQRDLAQAALDDATLRAPFAGVVAQKHVENFQEVQAKQPIVRLQDVSTLEFKVHVPESVIRLDRRRAESLDEVNSRLKIAATFDRLPDRDFPLHIVSFETQADPTTQTFAVTFGMAAPEDAAIIPGMTATVRVQASALIIGSSEGFPVPVGAVGADPAGASFVWTVDPQTQTVSRTTVTTGPLAGDHVQVLSGLRNGDTIVVSGVHALLDGMKVRPMEATRTGAPL